MKKLLVLYVASLLLMPSVTAQMSYPFLKKYSGQASALVVRDDGHVFYSTGDTWTIRELNSSGAQVNEFGELGSGPTQFEAADITWNYDGNLLITDYHFERIQVYTTAGTYVKTITQPDGILAVDIAFDAANNMYISETIRHRILVLDKDGEFIKTLGTEGTGDGQFVYPQGIFVTSDKLYVCDGSNNRVQVFDLEGNFLFKFGTGSGDQQLAGPRNIFVSGSIVYVTDDADYLRFYDLEGNYLGRQGGQGSDDLSFNGLHDIFIDGSEIYIADFFNYAIKIFSSKLDQIITFDAPADRSYGDEPFTLEAASTSDLPITFTSSDESIASISGNTVSIHKAGAVTITANQAGNENYIDADPVARTLTINKATQQISFPSIEEQEAGNESFMPVATASSGLPVSFSSSDESIAVVTSNGIHLIKPGAVIITAIQDGDDNYHAADPVNQILIVKKVSQAIAFSTIPAQVLGGQIELHATASSGLPVTFSTESTNVAIEDNIAMFESAGPVTITAIQPGDEYFAAAPSVSQAFCINPNQPSVVNDPEANLLVSNSENGNQWFRDNAVIDGATSKTFSPLLSGHYSVQVTIDGCKSERSEPVAWFVTAIEEKIYYKDLTYPNPTTDIVLVDLHGIEGEVDMKIVNNKGQIKSVDKVMGGAIIELDMRKYPPALYLLRVEVFGKLHTVKIVKQ